jgi:hypothetical protein
MSKLDDSSGVLSAAAVVKERLKDRVTQLDGKVDLTLGKPQQRKRKKQSLAIPLGMFSPVRTILKKTIYLIIRYDSPWMNRRTKDEERGCNSGRWESDCQ